MRYSSCVSCLAGGDRLVLVESKSVYCETSSVNLMARFVVLMSDGRMQLFQITSELRTRTEQEASEGVVCRPSMLCSPVAPWTLKAALRARSAWVRAPWSGRLGQGALGSMSGALGHSR